VSANTTPLRVFLFPREPLDAFHLRRAIGRSFERCFVDVLEQSLAGLRTARAVVRRGAALPGLVLFEQPQRDAKSLEMLGRIRSLPELSAFPLLILGDATEPMASRIAFRDGADGFVARPEADAELPRLGRDVARFWWRRHLSKSA